MDDRAGDAGLAGVWLWIDTLGKRDGLEQEEAIHCSGCFFGLLLSLSC